MSAIFYYYPSANFGQILTPPPSKFLHCNLTKENCAVAYQFFNGRNLIFFFRFFSGAFIGVIVSICIFNVTGITVTQEMSATTRMVLDSVRTIFIWMISLGLKVGKSQMQFFLPSILPPKNEQFFLLILPLVSKIWKIEID